MLDAVTTAALLGEIPAVFGTGVADVLRSALVVAAGRAFTVDGGAGLSDTVKTLAGQHFGPSIGFTYLGRHGVEHGLDAHAVEVVVEVQEGPDGPRLHAFWSWREPALAADVDALAASWFRVLVALAERPWDASPVRPAAAGAPVQVVLELSGQVDPVALCGAADVLVRKHSTLSRSFREVDGATYAVRCPAVAAFRMADSAELATVERAVPFDLARPPLIRFALARSGSARHQLVITAHPALLDGLRLDDLARELLVLAATRPTPRHRDLRGLPLVDLLG
ncbi:hypothetical protein Acsp05_40410 [Actinokineospora sp. NBRC 105648]|nr:hypothetical protein Acsp05_40410 [Actinokineospora sp. NBRC 105648]